MRLGIKYKLFFILLGATVVIIAGMFLFARISFEKGLLRYVDKREMKRLEVLCRLIEEGYEETGSWEFLTNNPRRWHTLKDTIFKPREGFRSRPFREHHMKGGMFHPEPLYDNPDKAMPPRMGRGHGMKHGNGKNSCVVLLDREKKTLFGRVGEADAVRLIPVISKGDTVGWLGLIPPKTLSEEDELLFFKRQSRILFMISVAMLFVSVVVAIWTAFYLERPIRVLARGTKALTSGAFATRIPVRSSDELGQLSSDFNALAQTLEENEKSRKQWVEDIAHELRTPLTLMSGEIEAVKDGIREMTPETLTLIQSDIARLIRLVSDLNELSQTDLGALSYKKKTIDVTDLVSQATERFREPYEAAGLILDEKTHTGGPIHIFGDGERITQLLENILDNSLNYTDPGGRVSIWVETLPESLILHVQDSGPGVPEESLGRLFDRLYRVDASRSRVSGGTGLGLAICKNIAEAHGGSIQASPSPFGGLWIKVSLPL